jgi:hypothetical protein
VTLLPWEYLWLPFTKRNFPDLFDATWIASIGLLVALIVLYAVRTKALHRHRLYTDMWEWLFWTGLTTFSMIVIGAIFRFDFAVVLVTVLGGLAVLAWVRFRRYPPLFEAYEHQLARQRYLARAKSSKPEATIRVKTQKRRKRR